MRYLLLPAILLAGLTFLPRPAAAQQPATCKVVYVLDGDTINCEGGVTVRLLLVDVPDRGAFGEEGRAFLVGLLPKGTEVRLEYDANPRDSEGRWLAYAFLQDGTFVNKSLVDRGFAYVEFSAANQARLKELREAEQVARGKSLGVWSQ
jgi:micrococcal nuclease